jgi:hypothetical protein
MTSPIVPMTILPIAYANVAIDDSCPRLVLSATPPAMSSGIAASRFARHM